MTDNLPDLSQVVAYVQGHPIGVGVIALTVVVLLILAFFAVRALIRLVRRWAAGRPTEDALTIVAATIATTVSASGMWHFFDVVFPGLPWPLKAAMFAFIEVAMVTSAVRARRNMREHFSAGLDGVAVWGLTVLSAVLSTLESGSFAEGVFRLSAPLVAAWLWERGMALERRRATGLKGIHWRFTPERILVRLGLAEGTDRTAGDVDAHRRIKRVALAVKRVQQLREAGAKDKKIAAAIVKRDRALDQAVEHTDLARNRDMQRALLDLITTLGGSESLSTILADADAPWEGLDHPAITGAAKQREAIELAAAMREWSDAIKTQRDPEVSAAITSMAAYIAGRPVDATVSPEVSQLLRSVPPIVSLPSAARASDETAAETRSETSREVDAQVSIEVSGDGIDAVIARLRGEVPEGGDETDPETRDGTQAATDAMWEHWQQVIEAERRIPTGAELARAGGCTPQYGARMRRKWREEMDGRKLRALEGKDARKAATA